MLALSFNSIITDLMPSLIGVDFYIYFQTTMLEPTSPVD